MVVLTLLGFHWVMDTYFGWGIAKNAAAKFSEGSWLALWWANNPSLLSKMFYVFMPFGIGWVYAAAGFRTAPLALRQLALGAFAPLLALNYVQNPERALANAFFVIVPLATIALLRVPFDRQGRQFHDVAAFVFLLAACGCCLGGAGRLAPAPESLRGG